MKNSKIKEALMRVLAQFNELSTDGGIVVWRSDNELPEIGEHIYIMEEDGTERTAEDGRYRSDNGWELVVEAGVLKEIIDIREQEMEEDENASAEEAVDTAESLAEEIIDVANEEKPEEEKVEEIKEIVEEIIDVVEGEEIERKEEEFEGEELSLLERLAALEAKVAALEEKLAGLETKPLAEPAAEEYKKLNKVTNDEKFGKLNRRMTAKW